MLETLLFYLGDLGSGKTKFTEGFLEFFGLDDEISSPTFTIVNEYYKNNLYIYHFDVYRLEDLDEFYAIGGTEYFDNGICLIEWGELIEPILSRYIKITINKDIDYENKRYIDIDFKGDFPQKAKYLFIQLHPFHDAEENNHHGEANHIEKQNGKGSCHHPIRNFSDLL